MTQALSDFRPSRSSLLSLLSQACEFEHGLACAYLFTSFSLKCEVNEGLSFEQVTFVRRWANDIFVIASEEMLHLAQVWNLIAAIGGNPYYWRPNFPVQSNFYPTGLPITLAPFSEPVLERFIVYELPDESALKAVAKKMNIKLTAGAPEYGSVAQLYTIVEEMIDAIPEEQLFIGGAERQVGSDLVDFKRLIKVVDRSSALDAVKLIKEQGEGHEVALSGIGDPLEAIDVDRDGHFGVFMRVLHEFRAESMRTKKAGDNVGFVRDVLENPVATERLDHGVPVVRNPGAGSESAGRLIQDPYTLRVAKFFDSSYLLMLRLLQYVFRNSTDDPTTLRAFSQTALIMMITLVKPIGESLTRLPAGKTWGNKTAGAPFGLSRHVTLPENPKTALVLVRENLDELLIEVRELAQNERAPGQLVEAARNLHETRDRLVRTLV